MVAGAAAIVGGPWVSCVQHYIRPPSLNLNHDPNWRCRLCFEPVPQHCLESQIKARYELRPAVAPVGPGSFTGQPPGPGPPPKWPTSLVRAVAPAIKGLRRRACRLPGRTGRPQRTASLTVTSNAAVLTCTSTCTGTAVRLPGALPPRRYSSILGGYEVAPPHSRSTHDEPMV